MKNEKIQKINTIGKIGKIVSIVVLVCSIIGTLASAGVSIAAYCVPGDIAKVNISGTANVQIEKKYFDIAKNLISDVKESMTEEGQELDIAGSKYQYVSADLSDDGNLSINYNSLKNEITVRDFATFMLGTAVECLMIAYIVVFIMSLSKALEKCESPFEENVISKMKSLAIGFVAWMLLSGIGPALQARAFTGTFEYSSSVAGASPVIVILCVVLLVFVFKYGAELQKQSDETL